jgi:hypothetical protein
LLLFAPVAAARDVDPPTAARGYEVRGIRAYFYYTGSGTFDLREDLNETGHVMRNVMIGEGMAEHPTSTTLVLVDLMGPAFGGGTKGSVTLVATNDDREMHRSSVPLMYLFTGTDSATVPFLVYGTGCGKLKLFASVESEELRADRSTVIRFSCGE